VDSALAQAAVGKVIGLGLGGSIPTPELFARQTGWSWFLLGASGNEAPERAAALRTLYADPRVVSRAADGSGGSAHH